MYRVGRSSRSRIQCKEAELYFSVILTNEIKCCFSRIHVTKVEIVSLQTSDYVVDNVSLRPSTWTDVKALLWVRNSYPDLTSIWPAGSASIICSKRKYQVLRYMMHQLDLYFKVSHVLGLTRQKNYVQCYEHTSKWWKWQTKKKLF